MPTISVRVDDETHAKVKYRADLQGVSISDCLRSAVERFITESPKSALSADVSVLQSQLKEAQEDEIGFLRGELTAVRAAAEESAQHAASASERADTIVLSLTQQLDRSTLQLEDLRQTDQRSLWARLFKRES
jgi:hypothetical protein